MSDHTADSWAEHVLAAYLNYTACTSTVSFSAINSGSTGGPLWFSYAFRGGPTSADDYYRYGDVEDSVVYSIAALGESATS